MKTVLWTNGEKRYVQSQSYRLSLDRQYCTGSHCRVPTDARVGAEKVDFLKKVFELFLGDFLFLWQFGPVALWLRKGDDVIKFVNHLSVLDFISLCWFACWSFGEAVRNMFDKNAPMYSAL